MTPDELNQLRPGDMVQNLRSKRVMFVKRVRDDGRLVLEKHGRCIPAANPLFWRVIARKGLEREAA